MRDKFSIDGYTVYNFESQILKKIIFKKNYIVDMSYISIVAIHYFSTK